MKKFIMMIGVSGSGKSSYAKTIVHDMDAVYLSSDEIRAELWGSEDDQQHPETVFKVMNKRMMEAFQSGWSVVYDATNLSAKRRTALLKQVRSYDDKIFCEAVVVVADIDACIIRRSRIGERHVPKEVIMRQVKSFQCPWYTEGWNNIQTVLGTPWADNRVKLADLRREAFQMEHENPHHLDTIGEHCANVQEFIDKRSACKMMNELGELHDIGKVLTKEKDENGIAHFFSHDNVSAYLSLYRCVGSSLKDFIYINQAAVIGWHMRDYHYRNNEIGFQKWLESLDYDTRYMLTLLMQADRACSID